MADDSIAMKAARGAGWIFAWRMVTRLLGLGSTLVLVRYLQPADFGLVAIAVAFAAGIDALSDMGVEYALIREKELDRALYDTAFTMNVLRGLLSVVIVALAAWPLAYFVGDPRLVPLVLVLSMALFMASLENIGVVEFRRNFAFDKEFILFLLPRLLGVCSNIILAMLWPSYWVLVIGTLLTRFGRMVLSYVIHPYRPRLSLSAWQPLFRYSVWIWAQSMVSVLRERADPVVLGRLLDPARVGIFSIGVEIAILPGTEIAQPISRVLFPGFAAAHHGGGGLADAFTRAVAVIATLILPVCFGMSLLADPIVRLILGHNWLAAVPIVQIISAASAVSVIGYAAGNVLGVAGKTRWQFLLTLGSACVRLPFLAFMVWRQELRGAAIAVAMSGVLDTTTTAVVVCRYLKLRWIHLAAVIWRPVLATALMVAVLAFSGLGWVSMAAYGSWRELIPHIILTSLVGGALYLGTLALTWLAMGRPAGAERFLLDLGIGVARRVLRFGGIGRD